LRLALVNSHDKTAHTAEASNLTTTEWSEASVDFRIPTTGKDLFADELHFVADKDVEFLIDDVLLYVPGE